MKNCIFLCSIFVIILLCGCSIGSEREDVKESSEVAQYFEFDVDIKMYSPNEFDDVVLGKTLLSELYATVGETPYSMIINSEIIDVYPLIDGRYLSVICKDDYNKTDQVDFTIDRMEITDENPWQVLKDKKYKIEDFRDIIIGKTTTLELYEKVGPTLHYQTLNTKIIEVYPLDDGRYLSVICWYYQTEEGFLRSINISKELL